MKSRHIIRWTLAGLIALIVIAAIGGYLFLKSTAFQQYALRKIAQTVEESTGGNTEIRALDFSLSTLTAHLYNITVHGTESAVQPPLLQIAKLTVGLKIQSVFHRKVNLRELIVERPVVNVRVDHAGHSNLPVTPPRQSSSHTSVFDLAVRHAELIQGEVNYNDMSAPLDADLYSTDADIHFDSAAIRYFGSVSYDNGNLRYGRYAPLHHSFQAKFGATPAELLIDFAMMKVGNSVVSIRAAVSNYADPAPLPITASASTRETSPHWRQPTSLPGSCRSSGRFTITICLNNRCCVVYLSTANSPVKHSPLRLRVAASRSAN